MLDVAEDPKTNPTTFIYSTSKNVLVTFKSGHKPKKQRAQHNQQDVYKVSFALESDNNFITYLVKRIAENMEKDDELALQEYIPQYSQAFDIASVDI